MFGKLKIYNWKFFNDRLANAIADVQLLTSHKTRTVKLNPKVHQMVWWSCGAWKWFAVSHGYLIDRVKRLKLHGYVNLDSFEIIFEAKDKKETEEIAKLLPAPPVAFFSCEAKDRGVYNYEEHMKILLSNAKEIEEAKKAN